ncbi:hypothetical protein [Maribacter sp. ACAM166]|uniref:hypothetical protein n=1 Tax=Maribacter sp. ACAM166 TaxID=2508996 RepID=UPI0010FEBDD7|nr:hypothetical protein [Maribacter sp. ACAM166]TLP76750.1 hypothetical protein ES765_14110 [Maribacter sp. ACAM166]
MKEATEELSEVVVKSDLKLNNKLRPIELTSMKIPLYAFGLSMTKTENILYVIGGNESYEQKNLQGRLGDDPTLLDPTAKIADLIEKASSNLNWEHYSGKSFSYSFDTDFWREEKFDLKERAYHNTVEFDDKIFVLGGKRVTKNMQREYLENDIELISLSEQNTTVDKTNPHQAINFGSLIFENNLVVFGGSTKIDFNGQKVLTDKVHLYNFSTGFWYELEPLSKAKETNGVLIGENIYMIGGSSKRALSEIEVYNIPKGTSRTEAILFEGMNRPGLTVEENIIYVLDKGKLLTYDSKEKLLNEYLVDDSTENPKIVVRNEYLYAFGGFYMKNFSKVPSDKVYKLNLRELPITKVNRTQSF